MKAYYTYLCLVCNEKSRFYNKDYIKKGTSRSCKSCGSKNMIRSDFILPKKIIVKEVKILVIPNKKGIEIVRGKFR